MPLSAIHRQFVSQRKSTQLAIIAIFSSIAYALIDTIWSVYINSFVNSASLVGLITGAMMVFSLFSYFGLTHIIVRFSERYVWITITLMMVVGYSIFAFVENFWLMLLVYAFINLVDPLKIQSFGIMLRDLSKKSELGEVQGVLYSLQNTGWVIGPLLSGAIASYFGLSMVFLFAAFFTLISYTTFRTISISHVNHKTKDTNNFKQSVANIKKFFSRKELVRAYLIKGGVSMHWSNIYIFVPLIMLHYGLGTGSIGVFLFAVAIPLILLEYNVGKVSDVYGNKIFFIAGYSILAAACFAAFFVDIYLALGILVFGSVGASFLESTRDAHFFSIIKKSEEEKYYGPFMTAFNVASITSKFVAGIALIFFHIDILFLLFAAEMVFFVFVSLGLKEKTKKRFLNRS